MNTERVLELIRRERQRQDEKWGSIYDNPIIKNRHFNDWWPILQEELGEAAEDYVENRGPQALIELVQAAAVIAAWIEQTIRKEKYDL